MNDQDFLQGLRAQEAGAVQHLTACHLPSLWRYAFVRVNGDTHLAEDVVSETILALVREAGRNHGIVCVAAWLRTVATNKIRDHFRAAARVQHLLGQVPLESERPIDDPGAEQDRRDRQHEVREIMDRLPEHFRQALEWKYLDQLSVRQVADRLELTEKAVESILFRARQEFRHELDRRRAWAESGSPPVNRSRPANEHADSQPESSPKEVNSHVGD